MTFFNSMIIFSVRHFDPDVRERSLLNFNTLEFREMSPVVTMTSNDIFIIINHFTERHLDDRRGLPHLDQFE
jgi:hypothetical protein